MCNAQSSSYLSLYLWPKSQKDEDEEITDEQRKALFDALDAAGWTWENQ